MASLNHNLEVLVRKTDAIFDLTEDERRALRNLPVRIEDIKARQDLVRFGERPPACSSF